MNGIVTLENGVQVWSPENLMKDAVPCSLLRDAHQAYLAEQDKIGYDAYALERARDWAVLKGQIVGSEIIK